MLSLSALGLGPMFPVSVVSIQNAVPRAQIGTATGAMNYFRALMSSFTVAVFTAILLMVLGSNLSIGAEQHIGAKHAIAPADMIVGVPLCVRRAALLLATAATLMMLMEERPLAGPPQAAELAE